MPIQFGTTLSYLTPIFWYEDWEIPSTELLCEQKRKFSDFKFSEPPCQNKKFALELFDIADVFIKDVSAEISEMNEYMNDKLDVKCGNLLYFFILCAFLLCDLTFQFINFDLFSMCLNLYLYNKFKSPIMFLVLLF